MEPDRARHHSSILRHFLSAALGLALAPIIWGLTAWSTYRFGAITRSVGAMSQLDKPGTAFIVPILLLVASGAFVGLLVGTQVSPIGPGLAGIAMISMAVGFLVAPESMLNQVAKLPGEQDLVLALPAAAGSAFLLGAALLVPMFSAARWRWVPAPVEEKPTAQRREPRALPPGASTRAQRDRSDRAELEATAISHDRIVHSDRDPARTRLVPAQRSAREDAIASTTTGRHRALSDADISAARRAADYTAAAGRAANDIPSARRAEAETSSATGRHRPITSADLAHDKLADTYAGRVGAEVPRRRQVRQTEPIPALVPDSGDRPLRPDDTLTRYAKLRPEVLDEPDFVWHIDDPAKR